MRLKVLSGLIVVLLVAGCSSNSQEEELQAALDRVEALEDQLVELATTTTEPAPPPTTTEPAPQYTRISSSYARKIATDALIDLTGRENIGDFHLRVDEWTEEFILANPGVTDLTPEEFDAWFREKIEVEYEDAIDAIKRATASRILKNIFEQDAEDDEKNCFGFMCDD
jgi:hypothetical protein